MAALRFQPPVQAPPAPVDVPAAPGAEVPLAAPPPAPVPPAPPGPQAQVRQSSTKAVVRGKQAPPVSAATAPAPGVQSTVAIKCSRLDDAKIDWLLQQVAKTKAENPDIAAGATTIEQVLLSARGKNLCASEAQVLVAQICAGAEAKRALDRMVAGLPFFVRSSLGDPCRANLVDVMNKMGAYVPGLSSAPS